MATLLKEIYNDLFFTAFCGAVKKILPHFKEKAFAKAVKQQDWETLELKQRMRRLSTALHSFMEGAYRDQLSVMLQIVSLLSQSNKVPNGSLAYMFLPDFVEQFGQQHLKLSLQAMEKMTPFTSCEFAIRPFLKSHPEQTIQQLLIWSKHPNEHVRRFASEGCRPRLPWAMAIEFLKKDPTPILPILQQLKKDDSEYVRRSVANNLNDISKDHPQLLLDIATEWMGKSSDTDRLLKHACRGLLKSGNPAALGLFGTSTAVPCQVTKLVCTTAKINIGDTLEFSFDLTLLSKKKTRLRIEYMIYFMKANGQQQPKIFKIGEPILEPNKTTSYVKKHSFKNLTTRKHYLGIHHISIVVNGISRQKIDFLLG